MKLIKGPVIGYKATDENMCCRGFQFELGKWYRAKGKLILCKNGFHFCEYPSGPWAYYISPGARIFKIEAKQVLLSTGPGSDLKHVAKQIKLVEEIKTDGYGNTGHGNTGDRNTGDGNTGDRNMGDRNTGDGNTGDRNMGHGNTSDGNTGDYHSGCLCFGEAPFYIFNSLANRKDVDFNLVSDLSIKLMSDKSFDPTPYLSLPNASVKIIKQLHKAHTEARRQAKN